MRFALCLVIATWGMCTGCGPSTDIAGSYTGNVTYTASITAPSAGDLAGAEPATVVLADGPNGSVSATLGGCTLATSQRVAFVTTPGRSGAQQWLFTSQDITTGQSCTVPITGGTITLSVVQGDLIVDAGNTMTLELGGNISSATGTSATAGYLAYVFDGATR